ncbi:unnamed protein product [Nippostrongylus brasiliensis]|uniref:Transcriptional regulator n=1 Tax=Nippostrongylus brasiliensis TaxID=27835 RepID=A0A0N4Y497_NIPBR|nr:unnamed protein product [Nippostrongylus brasiliensis]
MVFEYLQGTLYPVKVASRKLGTSRKALLSWIDLLLVILSDDNTLDSKYWYVAVRHCVKTMLTLSCDVDFITSKILGKALWYAHRAAQLLVMFREKEFSPEINAEFIKAR